MFDSKPGRQLPINKEFDVDEILELTSTIAKKSWRQKKISAIVNSRYHIDIKNKNFLLGYLFSSHF